MEIMHYAYSPGHENFAKDPAVVKFNGGYYLYYSIITAEKKLGIGIAESPDLVNWHYVKELIIESDVHPHGYGAPGAMVQDGKVYLFYQTYGTGAADAICTAVSPDGLNFTIDPTSPVFHPPVCDWSCGRAIDADIVYFKGKYFLYAATRDPEFRIQKIVVATSDGDFSRNGWTLAYDGSVMEPELPWEQECIEAPATLVHNDKIYMFYGGAYNCKPQQIGCAVSPDGIHFTRISQEPVLACGKSGEWNSSESGHPYAFTDDDGQQYLFYQGTNDAGKSWYLSVVKIEWSGDIPHFVTIYK